MEDRLTDILGLKVALLDVLENLTPLISNLFDMHDAFWDYVRRSESAGLFTTLGLLRGMLYLLLLGLNQFCPVLNVL